MNTSLVLTMNIMMRMKHRTTFFSVNKTTFLHYFTEFFFCLKRKKEELVSKTYLTNFLLATSSSHNFIIEFEKRNLMLFCRVSNFIWIENIFVPSGYIKQQAFCANGAHKLQWSSTTSSTFFWSVLCMFLSWNWSNISIFLLFFVFDFWYAYFMCDFVRLPFCYSGFQHFWINQNKKYTQTKIPKLNKILCCESYNVLEQYNVFMRKRGRTLSKKDAIFSALILSELNISFVM